MEPIPGHHFIEYPDGTYAQYIKKMLTITDSGTKKWRIWLRPSNEIINLFNLKVGEDIDPRTGIVIREYEETDVYMCRNDPYYSRLWIEKDFEGNQTSFSMRTDHLKEQIRNAYKI